MGVVQTKKSGASRDDDELKWQTIGWQGISLEVPSGWSLTGFGGDLKSGTLRCDSAEPESRTLPVGLEVRWIHSRRVPSDMQLKARADSLLASIEKSAKKARLEANTSVLADDGPAIEGRGPAFNFAWRTDRAASGKIWYCSICRRALIVQVYGLGGRAFVTQAEAILASIRCESHDPAVRTWGLYDLLVDVPTDYDLVGQKLMNIYIQLQFRRGASNDLLTVEQWSLANVQLKGAYLNEWFERKRDAMVSGIEPDEAEAVVSGHPALRLDGRKSGLAAVSDGIRSTMRFKKSATHYEAMLWECPESNKAYLVQSLSRRPQGELIEAMAGSLRCHEVLRDEELID